MTFLTAKLASRLAFLTSAGLLALAVVNGPGAPAQPTRPEPISYIGHGAMFDAQGRQILPNPDFIGEAQDWYLAYVVEQTSKKTSRNKDRAEKNAESAKLMDSVPFDGQDRLIARQALLEAMLDGANIERIDPRMPGKIRLLGLQLQWLLPQEKSREKWPVDWRETKFKPGPGVTDWLKERKIGPFAGGPQFLVTNNTGQDYIDECAANQVPIPPSINVLDPAGVNGWKIEGLIPQSQQFIVATPAEIRSYKTAQGVCIALPRFTGASMTTVALDGVICQSNITSKVCFWDNQRATPPSSGMGVDFTFGANQIIPIGVPTTAGGLYQGGGKEIEFGTGGVCTDCHAGENAYIVHPDAEIRPGYTFGQLSNDLPLFAPQRYDPIVGASWPQNSLSHSPALTPSECTGCHQQGVFGRLPHLSTDLPGYCGTVLSGAVTGTVPFLSPRPPTMPQGSPGSFAGTTAWNTFNAYCGTAPSAGPSNRGDPHLITTNNVSYDFQAAGEFTALKNSATGFELQNRQTPVVTSFVPGANPYTGLQSCVSLNTAAAVRMGKHRVSFQPESERPDGRMVLKIDGKRVKLPRSGIDLGNGNRILTAGAGGAIDVRADDGTRVLISPNFWSSQGYWYIDIEVLSTPAREGTLGPVIASSWLPAAPDGAGWGPRPATLDDRHAVLNEKFADAWRVKNETSLFDYDPGTSTETFTDRKWPSPPGGECTSTTAFTVPGGKPIFPIDEKRAIAICRKLEGNPMAMQQCVFDVTVMGDPNVVNAYRRTLMKRNLP